MATATERTIAAALLLAPAAVGLLQGGSGGPPPPPPPSRSELNALVGGARITAGEATSRTATATTVDVRGAPAPIALTRDTMPGGGVQWSGALTVVLENDTAADLRLTHLGGVLTDAAGIVRIAAVDAHACASAPARSAITIVPGQVLRVPLCIRIAGGTPPFVGRVLLRVGPAGARFVPARTHAVRLIDVRHAWMPVWVIVGLPLALALAVATTASRGPATRAIAPEVEWQPGSSWATNLAVIAGVFSALLASASLPEHTRYLTRASYVTLNAVFAGIVAAVPAAFSFLHAAAAALDDASRARRWVVAAPCGAIVWAGTGQLAVSALVLHELALARVLPAAAAWAFIAFEGAVAAMLCRYVQATLRGLPSRATERARVVERAAIPGKMVAPAEPEETMPFVLP